MRNIIILLFFFNLTQIAFSNENNVSKIFSYDFDLRNGGDLNSLGVDFNLTFSVSEERNKGERPVGHHFRLDLVSNGYKDFSNEPVSANYMDLALVFAGSYFASGLDEKKIKEKKERYLELLGKNNPTHEEIEERDILSREIISQPDFYLEYDSHLKFESTQDLKMNQTILGISLASDVPLLHNLLDIFPSATRTGFEDTDKYTPQPARLYIALDYVFNSEGAQLSNEDKPDFPRLSFEGAWRTEVFRNKTFKILWLATYLFDSPSKFKQLDREFNSFVEMSISAPLDGNNTSIIVKYIDGYLQPEYENVAGGFIGLNFLLD